VNVELPGMERAYKKAVAASQQKVLNFAAMEEKINMLNAEKSKADQKYFAARKDMDTRIAETRSLRAQNAKSSEIISQLKDVETSNRSLLTTLEKQLSDMRHANNSIMADNKKLEGSSTEATSKVDALKAQIAELTALLKTKDSSYSSFKQHAHSIETDLEQLKAKYETVQKDKEVWKAKSLSNQSGEEEMLRVRTHVQVLVS
jgi:E3 ubiquitin-protein ligase BRE1